MINYCKDYILETKSPKKRKKNSKLHTFTQRSDTTRDQNNKVKQLEEINRNALQALKARGITVQTSPYPLALATMNGCARTGSKSTFRTILKQQPQLGPCFMNTLPHNFNNFCLITDFMCYIHMPPPNNISKYSEYFNYLWDACITGDQSINNNVTSVIFVFDKPEYLPPPRELVHDKRAKGVSSTPLEHEINDSVPVPRSRDYSALLTKPEFKNKLLRYITDKLVKRCIQESSQTTSVTFVVDSPTLPAIYSIQQGTINSIKHNQHGEGDVGVWYHCLLRPEKNVLIVSSDTDIWMYGLLLTELSHQLQSRATCVKCLNSSSMTYINVTQLYESICTHPQLEKFLTHAHH